MFLVPSGILRAAARFLVILSSASLCAAATSTADQLIDYGRWKQARVVIEQQYKANPNDARTVYLLSKVRFAFGDVNTALSLAQRAVALNDKDPNFHLAVAEFQGEIAQRSNLLKQALLARQIKKELETAAALDSKNVDALNGLMQYYLLAPSIAGGDRSKARALADQIVKLDAPMGYMAHAMILTHEKQTDALGAVYQKAIDADPKNYEARLALARWYASDPRNNYAKAEELLRSALKIDTGRIGAYVGLASLYALRENWSELDNTLSTAEKNIGDNLAPYFHAARILVSNNKDLPRAERYLKKYLTQEPEGGTPSLALAHWRLAQVYEKQGRKQEAISELQAAINMKPDFDDARKDLAKLK